MSLLLVQPSNGSDEVAIGAHKLWLTRQYQAFKDELLAVFTKEASLELQVNQQFKFHAAHNAQAILCRLDY